jgi:hypothetical protein
MRIFHDKHFKEDTLFLVNWTIYAAIGALAAWAQFRDQLRPAEQRGVASARPLEEGGIRQ